MTTPNMLALRTMTPTVIVSQRIAVNTDTAVFTVPVGQAVKLAQGTIANVTGAACTVGLAINGHKVIPDSYSLAAGAVIPLDTFIKEHLLGEGDTIAVHAGAVNALDVVISAAVMT